MMLPIDKQPIHYSAYFTADFRLKTNFSQVFFESIRCYVGHFKMKEAFIIFSFFRSLRKCDKWVSTESVAFFLPIIPQWVICGGATTAGMHPCCVNEHGHKV